MDEKRSPSARRTVRAIKEAFLSCLEIDSFEKVTMQMIAERAETSKQTIYRYFPDKYALLDEIQRELIRELTAFMTAPQSIELGYFREFYRLISRNRGRLQVLYDTPVADRNISFQSALYDVIYRCSLEWEGEPNHLKNSPAVVRDYYCRITAGCTMSDISMIIRGEISEEYYLAMRKDFDELMITLAQRYERKFGSVARA